MWYFAWILGVLLACSLGIINGLWFEHEENEKSGRDNEDQSS